MPLKRINRCNQHHKSLPLLWGGSVIDNGLMVPEAEFLLSDSLRSFIWSCKRNQKCLDANVNLQFHLSFCCVGKRLPKRNMFKQNYLIELRARQQILVVFITPVLCLQLSTLTLWSCEAGK